MVEGWDMVYTTQKVVYHTLGIYHGIWVHTSVIYHVIWTPQKCDITCDIAGTWL